MSIANQEVGKRKMRRVERTSLRGWLMTPSWPVEMAIETSHAFAFRSPNSVKEERRREMKT